MVWWSSSVLNRDYIMRQSKKSTFYTPAVYAPENTCGLPSPSHRRQSIDSRVSAGRKCSVPRYKNDAGFVHQNDDRFKHESYPSYAHDNIIQDTGYEEGSKYSHKSMEIMHNNNLTYLNPRHYNSVSTINPNEKDLEYSIHHPPNSYNYSATIPNRIDAEPLESSRYNTSPSLKASARPTFTKERVEFSKCKRKTHGSDKENRISDDSVRPEVPVHNNINICGLPPHDAKEETFDSIHQQNQFFYDDKLQKFNITRKSNSSFKKRMPNFGRRKSSATDITDTNNLDLETKLHKRRRSETIYKSTVKTFRNIASKIIPNTNHNNATDEVGASNTAASADILYHSTAVAADDNYNISTHRKVDSKYLCKDNPRVSPSVDLNKQFDLELGAIQQLESKNKVDLNSRLMAVDKQNKCSTSSASDSCIVAESPQPLPTKSRFERTRKSMSQRAQHFMKSFSWKLNKTVWLMKLLSKAKVASNLISFRSKSTKRELTKKKKMSQNLHHGRSVNGSGRYSKVSAARRGVRRNGRSSWTQKNKLYRLSQLRMSSDQFETMDRSDADEVAATRRKIICEETFLSFCIVLIIVLT